MGCGLDVWRIHGKVEGKPICPSSPIDFDEITDTFKTVSGSVYHILSYGCDREMFIEQIRKDIANKGYERH